MNRPLTYISLFSGAGVGCHGFKLEGFECVATNEIVSRRLDVQRYNKKCKYDSGYIRGDIALESVKEQIRREVELWKTKEGVSEVDVILATPPCQGMSVANHKKTEREIIRNSLVVESIKIISEYKPHIFVFENVPAFMKTICTDIDGIDKTISEAIRSNLGNQYSFSTRIINFKDYGACSSRSRTLVIGVRLDLADDISPYFLFPDRQNERTLRQVIGGLKSLNDFGEISDDDIYHSFRTYPEYMREWIHDLGEGESAFDNPDPRKRPHQIKNGVMVENIRKNGDKYQRTYWDKAGPCVHTRNDQLASQNTIHPRDDRVFSIRELMLMMTVPEEFKWSESSLDELNALPLSQKRNYLRKEEIKIRQSLGEAVPTAIFRAVAANIRRCFFQRGLTHKEIKNLLRTETFSSFDTALEYLSENPDGLSLPCLMRVAEMANSARDENAAYYTNQRIITEIMNRLPDISGDTVRILEPSVGAGCFILQLVKRFDSKSIVIDAVDKDEKSLIILKALTKRMNLPDTVTVNIIRDDFLLRDFNGKIYDYIIGNPPFGKITKDAALLRRYKKDAVNQDTNNICSYFLDKSLSIGSVVSLVLPKAILNAPEFSVTRKRVSGLGLNAILDFGENGFKGVLVETVALCVNVGAASPAVSVYSMTRNLELIQRRKYICDDSLPYWVIYRDKFFDRVAEKLRFDVFTVFRDRQITNAALGKSGTIRVLKSRNISDDGTSIINIPGYDSYIEPEKASALTAYRFLDRDDVFLTPNMTYYPRVIRKPGGVLTNGSVAVLIPKDNVFPTDDQLSFFSSEEYRRFYMIARNYQTRSLNIDACSVFFFGLKKEES